VLKKARRNLLKPFEWAFTCLCEHTNRIVWVGDYNSWDGALEDSCGYNDKVIMCKVRDALLKVKKGEAVYERDSFLFYEVQYEWPLLSGLCRIASENSNCLRILDYGGSLGSTYFQNNKFLLGLDSLKWCIVEQPHFVECGKEFFQNEELEFYNDIDTCVSGGVPNVALLSSVLAYLEHPFSILDSLMKYQIEWIIVNRTFILSDQEEDRLTVQKVPSYIYKASYPCWFFGKKEFLKYFEERYKLITEFDTIGRSNIHSRSMGFIFKLKKNITKG